VGVYNHQQGLPALAPPDFLHRFGPIASVEVHVPAALAELLAQSDAPIPSPAAGWALVDTGAGTTCVDARVISRLGVSPIDVIAVGTAGGVQQQGVYPAALRFPGMEGMRIEFSAVLGVDLSGQVTPSAEPLICLVGRDLLRSGLFMYNGMTGAWTLARHP
jgi:hypothetical protein